MSVATWIVEYFWSWFNTEPCPTKSFLNVGIGHILEIYRKKYIVKSINTITENCAGKDFIHFEYVLKDVDKPRDDDPDYRLWVFKPVKEQYLILFKVVISCDMDKAKEYGLYDSVRSGTCQLNVDLPDGEVIAYKRRFDNTSMHNVQKKIYNGDIHQFETTMSYWDYEQNESYMSQYLFVMESADGFYNVLEGNEIYMEDIK